ncbi:ATP-binding protein [Leptospira interrogans]|uniref:ATP-binding protein n=1 Tax=Leptospira interrogans TaxID=173 RepID=UPI0002BBCE2C|nr:ATP-binding protein [Leptospira interrogans]AKH76106.1 ATPase [Leptospira interrogans serovar Bratislava]EMN08293.1 GHKL domain protein [Leptospira interrogans serovar Muenchen str. Brem 129]KLO77610.1 GHKL domain protein [Leptospira interrogans serovar Muenchen]KWV23346.1 histidine kinase [Leptospira interrogans]KWV24127.1 histidine kinase [Leptospira interrogans]
MNESSHKTFTDKINEFYKRSFELFSKGSYLEEMDKFYSLCKTTLYADFIILLESKDPLSIKIVESQPKFNFSIDQTNINLLSISYSENRPVLPYTLTRQEINFSNFDALEEIDFAQMIAVPIPNENIEDRRKNILLFLYSKNTEHISEFLKLITELSPRIYEIFSIKNKEILLNSVHSRLDSILKTIPQAIIFMDSGTGKTWINESAAKLLSLSEGGEVSSWKVSTSMTELIQSAVNQKEIFLEMNRNLSNMNLEKFSTQWMFTDPEKKVFEVTSLLLPGKTAPGRLWFFEDITSFHSQQETLALLNQALKEKSEIAQQENQAKTVFISNISHEIRTPMTGILGITELLLNTPLNPDQKDSLELIQRSGDKLLKIVNHLLDFSKADTGKIELESIPFNMQELLNDLVSLLRTEILKNKNELNILFPPNFPKLLKGDPVRIGQILTNLVSNATKFTKEGTVEVGFHILEKTNSELSFRTWVFDTGIGIPPTKFNSVFEPFVQSDKSITRHFGGTGLGLSITKKLIELMGGKIHVESQPGIGTRFWFELKLEIPESINEESFTENSEAEVITDKSDLSRLKVLIVEDNLINQKLLGRILKKKKIEPFLVEDGMKAIEKARKFHYDLIFMDINMPGIDGLSATEIIRKFPKGDSIRIVGLTANAAPEIQKVATQRGMDDLLTKPYNVSQIEKILNLFEK